MEPSHAAMQDILAGVFFSPSVFFSRICNCICMHHVSRHLLAGPTMFFPFPSFVCILFVSASHVQMIHFCAFVILVITRLLLSACGNAEALVTSLEKLLCDL